MEIALATSNLMKLQEEAARYDQERERAVREQEAAKCAAGESTGESKAQTAKLGLAALTNGLRRLTLCNAPAFLPRCARADLSR